LQAAADFDMYVARVPSYSPNAIAELSLTLAMSLLRHTAYTTNKTSKKDFTVDSVMFSKEIRNCKVGIIGTGKIGLTEAQLFSGLGAEVLGYDIYQSEEAKQVVTFVELDELLRESDIVSLHVPYFPGKNDKMVNDEFISKMKNGAIFINTARGELQDNEAIQKALRSHKLEGFATDVFANEQEIFFQQFNDGKKLDPTIQALIDLYPRVLVTPHIGSNTDEALTNMIETSFENLHETITKGSTTNAVALPEKSQAVS
jgi:D-lactate dehydrogenase